MTAIKDSGVEWIGEIPEDWNDCMPLRFCASLKSATSPFDPNKPYLALENISSWTGKVMSEEQPDQVDSSVANYSRSDVLFGKLRPYLAKVVRPTADGQCSTELLPISPTSFDRDYLFWLLINKGLIDTVNSMTYGVKMPRTSWLQLGALYCPVPPRKEQANIAAFLDNRCAEIDNVSQTLKSQIAILERYRASVINEAVTRGLNPSTPTKPSGVDWIRDIPVDWNCNKIKNITTLKTGRTPDTAEEELYYGGTIDWFTPGDLSDRTVGSAEKTITERAIADGAGFIVPKNSVLLVGIGATAGKTGFLKTDAATNQQITALIPEERFDGKYLFYVMLSMRQRLNDLALYATVPILNNQYVDGCLIPEPPYDEQHKIADYLDARTATIDAVLDTKRKQLDILKRRRQSLIYEYVTGKRRVAEED